MVKSSEKEMSPFLRRTMTAILLVPFVISILVLGSPYIEVFLILVGILLAWEWANIVPNKGNGLYLGAYSFAVSTAIGFPKFVSIPVIVLTTLFIFLKSKGEERRGLLTLGVPYISIGIASLAWIYQETGLIFFIWVLFVVWGMDTGGYLVGSTLKGPKLMPKISPKKTYSGLIGGLIFSALAGSLVIWYVEDTYKDVILDFVSVEEFLFIFKSLYIVMGIFAMIFGFISQIGDFVESSIKRKVGVKDSSNLIPGHGGVFDRVDALMFVAPFVYAWICLKFIM